jgi:glycosyltransferase EpsD
MKKVLFTATVDSHILHFHVPFLKMFKEKGYEVHVATNGTEKIPYCDVKHTISMERSPYSLKNIKAVKQLKKIINEEKFDIIHCHTPVGGVVTRLAAKKARKKYHTRVIYTAHGFHFYKGAPKKNWLLFYPVEKYLAKYTDTLITINQEDYELAKSKFSKRCKNIEYVPGVGIDETKFNFKMTKKEKSELKKSLGLKDSDFVMIYPARLDKNKNQIFLINCMKELVKKNPDIHLLLPGEDELNGYYQKVTKEKGLDSNIHFLGYRKDIPRLLKISDLAVSSSLREGLPVNIIESMVAGLPVVALECRGVRDIIKNDENGKIIKLSANSENQFVNSVLKYEKNKLVLDTRKIVNYLFLEKISSQMDKIYLDLKKHNKNVKLMGDGQNRIPRIIHYVWMGKGKKNKTIQKCMKTWKKLNGYKIIEWNEDNFDVNSNDFVKKAYQLKKWAFVSDYIRAYAIYNYGGVYFDTDILLVKKIDNLLNNRAFVGYESSDMPFTAVFGAEKHHPFVKKILDYYDKGRANLEIPNTEFICDILKEDFSCKSGNVEQILDCDIRVYKKEVLCEPSFQSKTIHVFTGTWIENKTLFSKFATYIRKNSNSVVFRIMYLVFVLPIKRIKNKRGKK